LLLKFHGNSFEFFVSVNFWNFVYFLACPSLVYEVSFPRTSRIRWSYFFSLLFQALATFFVLYLFCTFQTFSFQTINNKKLIFFHISFA
jgi:hypothetical protein